MCIYRSNRGEHAGAGLLAMATHVRVCVRTHTGAARSIHGHRPCLYPEPRRIEGRNEMKRRTARTSASERKGVLPCPALRGQSGTCAATEQRYTRRPYSGQANSSVAARIINLFPWQPRRDPHHWLRRFSHPRAITLYGRTANYRCRDTFHRFATQHRRGL